MAELPSRGERLVDVLIAIARSEYPNEWSHYCDLAQKLAQEINKQAFEFSTEDCAQRRLNGKDRDRLGLIADFHLSLAGAPPSKLQQMTWEATGLEHKFRDRLISALRSDAYSITGFTPDLRPISIPPELISAELIRFDRDEIKLDDMTIMGVRAAPVSALNLGPHAPGPKPGRETAKRRADDAVRAILGNDAERPPKGRGRMSKLAKLFKRNLPPKGFAISSIRSRK
jgi:hypothetical protein